EAPPRRLPTTPNQIPAIPTTRTRINLGSKPGSQPGHARTPSDAERRQRTHGECAGRSARAPSTALSQRTLEYVANVALYRTELHPRVQVRILDGFRAYARATELHFALTRKPASWAVEE